MTALSREQDLYALITGVDSAALRRVIAEAAAQCPEVERAITRALRTTAQSMVEQRADLPMRLIGQSEQMELIREAIRQVAGTSLPVLVTGESGTGKELVARAVHALSDFAYGPFVAVNCGAIPPTLIASELFGHEKGSFTGAVARQIGQIEQAHNGTLFLDEIGELPLDVQATLLRFLQDFRIRRIGGSREIPINCRIISATNVDLRRAVARKSFRQDLFYRLDVFSIRLPSLRERGGDAVELAEFFVDSICEELRRPPIRLSRDARRAVAAYPWPGNVRELMSKLRTAVVLCQGEELTAADFRFAPLPADEPVTIGPAPENTPPVDPPMAPPVDGRRRRQPRVSPERLRAALDRHGGNVAAVSRDLNVSRVTIYKLIKRYSLRRGDFTGAGAGSGGP